ncbi:protein D2-like [Episyrphus balteatus]|uniref:protein D2-like n=1 Tax=Episyrphus balteatus TaxID=286459 RepID=UPI002486712E|nr:protein D2-like [Episyrphus balteatus]
MNRIVVFLLVVTTSKVCLSQESESDITKALKEYKVIPDVINEDVPETLQVVFNSGAIVDKGNIILPSQAKDQPFVDWNADENAFYTIMCVDPDAPYPEDPFLGQLNTWTIGNIPGKNILAGDVLFEYIGSAPPKGADLNRYIFLLYKQLGRIEFDETYVSDTSIEGRAQFSANSFAEKYNLSLVAANFYRSEYDEYVDDLYRKLNCCFEYNKE